MMKFVPAALICGAVFAAGSSHVAQAQSRAPITQGMTDTQVSQELRTLRESNADLGVRVNDLRREISRLNGELETLRFLLGQSRDEINRMQNDDKQIADSLSDLGERIDALGERLKTLEARPRTPPPGEGEANQGERRQTGETAGPASQPDPGGSVADADTGEPSTRTGEPERDAPAGTTTRKNPAANGSLGQLKASDLPGEAGALFAEAKTRLRAFDYAGAEDAFSAFLDVFGDDPQAGAAQYWLGEALYQQEEYEGAARAYLNLIQTFPDDPRAPDALVKLARSMRLVGESEKACQALATLSDRYPDASRVTRNLAAVERTRAECGA